MKLSQKIDQANLQLGALEDKAFAGLDFDWEGIKFHVASDTDAAGSHRIQLNATLGRLYFTVEDKNQRAMALDRLFTINRTIDGLYAIGKNGDIHFKSATKTDNRLKGTQLMSALTIILLEAESHLRAIQAHLKPNYRDLEPTARKSA